MRGRLSRIFLLERKIMPIQVQIVKWCTCPECGKKWRIRGDCNPKPCRSCGYPLPADDRQEFKNYPNKAKWKDITTWEINSARSG
jgi:hypothetical protein